MKNYRKVLSFSVILISVAVGMASGVSVSAGTDPDAKPIPTPERKPMPTPLAKPIRVAAPSPTPIPTPTPAAVQTLADLQSKIRGRIFAPAVARGRIGVKIVSLNTGKVVFENDADKYYMPASNMKNFTVSTALERLGPDFKFVTSVYAGALPDANGVIKGDLRIFGRGDVSISTAFNNGDYYKGLDNLVDKIATAGVKRVEGSLVADESYFKGFAIPAGWEWDDLQFYYGAEVSAFPVNDTALDLSVLPSSVGSPCVIKFGPDNAVVQVINKCVTGPSSGKKDVRIEKKLDRNVVEINGSVPVGDSGLKSNVAVSHPAELFIAMLKQRLELKGITVTGSARGLAPGIPVAQPQVEITKLESPSFSVIAAKTLKPSQNMYTETILWTLGEEVGRKAGASGESGQIGLSVVKAFMKQIGVPDDGIVQYDGSGLSRHDLITPNAVVTVYTYMAKQSKYAQVWRESLTIGGVDGTLANRFKGTLAAGNMRGKTGTIDQVSALSGYLTTASGEPLVISFVVNGVPSGSQRTALIDDIVVQLANFNGKIDQ